jgi:hypothetical protein
MRSRDPAKRPPGSDNRSARKQHRAAVVPGVAERERGGRLAALLRFVQSAVTC